MKVNIKNTYKKYTVIAQTNRNRTIEFKTEWSYITCTDNTMDHKVVAKVKMPWSAIIYKFQVFGDGELIAEVKLPQEIIYKLGDEIEFVQTIMIDGNRIHI